MSWPRCRRDIVEQLAQTPGLNKNQLRKRLDVFPETLEFHLDRLVEADLAVTQESAQEKEILCFLTKDEELWANEKVRIMFGRKTKREIGLFVVENPGASTSEIAEAVGVEKVTVQHHLRTLRDHKMIQKVRVGTNCEYHPSDDLEEWHDLAGDGFDRPWGDLGSSPPER